MGRRRAPIMSFQEAFNLTNKVAGGLMSSREIDKLGPDAESVQGVGLKITAPDGTQSTGVVDPSAGADYDAITKAYTDQGFKVEKLETPQYASRTGSKDTGVYADEGGAKTGARDYNQGLKLKKADVYQKYGMEDDAKRLRAESRQDRQDMRQEKMDGQQSTLNDQRIAVGKVELEAKERKGKQVSMFDAGLDEISKLKFDSDEARASAVTSLYEKAFGPEEALAIRSKYTAQDLSSMTLQSRKLDNAWEMAFKSNNADNVAKVYDDVNNDRDVKVVRGKSGIEVIEYDRNDPQGTAHVVARGKDDAEVVDKVRMMVTPGAKLEWAKYELDKLKAEAAIRASDSQAAENRAGAGLKMAQTANVGRDGGNEKLTALTGYANSLNAEVANADKALANAVPGSPQEKALSAQRDRALSSLKEVRSQIESSRFNHGGDSQGGDRGASLSDGAKAQAMNIVAKAVRSGKTTLEAGNAELRSYGAPELMPEDVAPARKPVTQKLPPAPASREQWETDVTSKMGLTIPVAQPTYNFNKTDPRRQVR